MTIRKIINHILFLCSLSASSYAAPNKNSFLPDLDTNALMNGISPSSAKNFWDHWHLVSVRYRNDNGEQRFIYANDIAWRALKDNVEFMPDGSMLGKIAFTTAQDHAFPNSVEPTEFSRIQLMLKDTKAYPKTNGWGYALYFKDPTMPHENHSEVMTACHACHAVVPDRDFIFSSPTFVGPEGRRHRKPHQTFADTFQLRPVADLGPFAQQIVRELGVKQKEILVLSMALFAGSIDESIGPVLEAVTKTGLTYLLFDESSRLFIFAEALPTSTSCPEQQIPGQKNQVHPRRIVKSIDGKTVFTTITCIDSKLKWQKTNIQLKPN